MTQSLMQPSPHILYTWRPKSNYGQFLTAERGRTHTYQYKFDESEFQSNVSLLREVYALVKHNLAACHFR